MALRFVDKNREDKSRRTIAIVIGIIMLASTIGTVLVFYAPSSTNFRYGGVSFKQQAGQQSYVAQIGGSQIRFYYTPEELVDINVSREIKGMLTNGRVIWIAYDWNSSETQEMALLQFDLAIILAAKHNTYAQSAFTSENPLNVTVKGCGDATDFVRVMLLQESNSTSISTDSANPDCIVVNATQQDFQMAADRIKYAAIGG